MASFRTSAAGGSTSGTGDRTVAITPAVDDLLVVYCFVSTNTNDSPTCTDNNGSGTYTRIDVANVVIATINHRLSVFVRDALMTNTTSTTITVATGSNTSGAVHVHAWSGMTRVGSNAVRSKGLQNNQASGTAAPTLNQTSLGTNPTAVALGSADTTTTPPTLHSERQDTNFATPTIALESATRDGGFSGTTLTFGASTSTTFCSHAMELDSSVAPSQISGTAALAFTGTNALVGSGALAGVTALVLAGAGTMVARITGTATLTTTATAQPYHPYTQLHPFGLVGMRYGSFNKPPGRMSGSGALALGGTATPSQTIQITATASLAIGTRGQIPRYVTQLHPTMWVGMRYGSFDRTASIGDMTASAALAFGNNAMLTGAAAVLGTTTLDLGGAGALTGTGALTTSTPLVFDAAGLPVLPSGQIVGTAALVFGGTNALTGTGALAGTAALLLDGFGTAVAAGGMAGTAELVFTTAALPILPAGLIVGSAALSFTERGVGTRGLLYQLQGYYRFENNLIDSSGNGRHKSGTVTYTPGIMGLGLASGTGTVNPWTGNTAAPFSFSFWWKPVLGTSGFVRWNSSPLNRFGLLLLDGRIYRDQGIVLELAGPLSFGVLHHIVYTLDSGGVAILYVDGIVVNVGTGMPPAAFASFQSSVDVPAALDELAVYATALTAAEVETLYGDGGGFYPIPPPINRVVFPGTVVTRRVFEEV